MRLTSILFFAMVIAACHSGTTSKGYETGNGGDEAQAVFSQARNRAAEKIMNLKDCSFSDNLKPEMRSWIIERKLKLNEEVLNSEHQWHSDPQDTCAWTARSVGTPLRLSYGKCRGISSDKAEQILIHEAIHRLGKSDETFPTEASKEIYFSSRKNCVPEENEILWLDDASFMKKTVELQEVQAGEGAICFHHTAVNWPVIDVSTYKTTGNYWVVAFVNSQWTATTSEWIGPEDGIKNGNTCQHETSYTISLGHPYLKNWHPLSGELVGFMLSTPTREGARGPVSERSNIKWTRWR
jgi:hypothetical protein